MHVNVNSFHVDKKRLKHDLTLEQVRACCWKRLYFSRRNLNEVRVFVCLLLLSVCLSVCLCVKKLSCGCEKIAREKKRSIGFCHLHNNYFHYLRYCKVTVTSLQPYFTEEEV